MKLAALALLGLLAVSVFATMHQAYGLDAITFTTKTTFSTASTLPQVLYENGTNSVIALDGTGAGVFEKDVYSVAAGTVSSATTTLSGSGNTINSAAYMGPVDLSRYSVAHVAASNQYDDMGDVLDMGTSDWTLVIKGRRDATAAGVQAVVGKRDVTATTNPGYGLQINNGVLQGHISDGSAARILITGGTNLGTGTFQTWAISFDRDSTMSLYVNGVSDATPVSISAQQGDIQNAVNFNIARQSAGTPAYCQCTIDEIFVYNTAKSAAQILSISNGNLDTSGLQSWWDYNDGIGVTLKDRASSNTGTLTNGPTWGSATMSTSQDRPTSYITGRDTATGVNGYAKINLSDLSEVADGYQTSALYPRNIAQSTTSLYSPLYNNTAANGALNLGIQTRALASYSEPAIYTGSAGNPAHGLEVDTGTTGAQPAQVGGATGTTVAAEKFTASSAALGYTFDSLALGLKKFGTPTGTATVGTFDSSGNVVTTFGTLDVATLTTTEAWYPFLFTTPYTIASDDRIGIKFTGGDASNYILLMGNSADLYDGVNTFWSQFSGGSWADSNTTYDYHFQLRSTSNVKIAVYDGSPDTTYTIFESGASNLCIVKYTSSASTVSCALTHTAGEDYSIAQLSTGVIIQTDSATYFLNASTDAVSTLYSNTFLTSYPQTFTISPAARTYNSAGIYIANTENAYLYTPNGGASASDYVMIDDATAPTLTAYDPAKYYYLQTNDLTVEASSATSTSWTIKEPGTQTDFTVTPYSEHVGISLVQNSTLFDEDVFQLVCDNGAYTVNLPYFATGSDADCTEWKVLATSGLSVGREIFGPFARTVDLVHANPFTAYSFELSATDPTVFTLKSLYDGKIVDVNIFDASGQSQQRYLYGNCYSVQVINNNNGQIINPGQICANDATTKTLNLQTLTIPTNWTSTGWHYNVTRSFGTGNVTTSNIQFDTLYNPVPYTANVLVTDSYLTQYQTFQTWYNFTSVNATSTIAVTKPNNSTIYFIVYDANMIPRLTVASPGSAISLVAITTAFAPLGDLFGIPVTAFFVILGAAIFVRSNSPFGVIVVTAIAGFMFATGILSISAAAWGGIMVVAALGAIYAIKRF